MYWLLMDFLEIVLLLIMFWVVIIVSGYILWGSIKIVDGIFGTRIIEWF